MRPFSIVGVIVVAFALIAGALGSFYTVDEGERGVITYNGKVSGTADPGLHFKNPLFEDVSTFDVRSQSRLYDQVSSYSNDQQTAALKVSVNFRVPSDQVTTVYSQFGSTDALATRLLDRKVYEQVKIVFGAYTAASAIQKRGQLNAAIADAVQKSVQGPIIVESVQIEDIKFSNAYENSIEQRMLAEVEVQKVRQNADREKVSAEITVIQAKAQADSQLARAQAEAQAITLRGDAEARAIDARGKALRDNPVLVQLVQAEKWDGKLPATMVPGSAMPFIGVK